MAAELEAEFGVVARLVIAEHGDFEVIVDGRKVFSMAETGRLPRPGEVTAAVKKRD